MSTFSFQPDAAAVQGLPWNVTYLSQRDVTANIPINFVTRAGVSLAAACFAHNRFEDNAAAKCISNLLAAGFGRWNIDLYWNRNRRQWSFCPVEIPDSGVYTVNPSSSTISVSSGASVNTTRAVRPTPSSITASATVSESSTPTEKLGARDTITGRTRLSSTTSSSPTGKVLKARATTSSTMSVTPSTIIASTSISANATYIVLPTPLPGFGEPLYQVGPYTCSRSLDISTLTSVLANFLDTTDNTLQAFLYYFTFNIHLAASYQDPTAVPAMPDAGELPSSTELLSGIFNAEFVSYLYTPTLLVQQRQNLNISWLGVPNDQRPATAYFELDPIDNNDFSTPNGWPSQSFLEVDKQKRLLVSLGSIDDNMQGYNTSGDSGTIWQNDAFENNRSVTLGTNNIVTSGCLFQSGTSDIQAQNTSWATSLDLPQLTLTTDSTRLNNITIPAVTNITACGISPLLDQTLANTTADVDVTPYAAFVHASIWSWTYGQPISTNDDDDDDNRCAVLDTTLSGHWRATDCDTSYHGACRTMHSPYDWRITTDADDYRHVNATCPPGTIFATPRTALENSYLVSALRSSSYASETSIWLNFNSMEVDNCWVVGVGTACPYQGNVGTVQAVTVPVVAGVIILVLAVLMLVIKCGSNRRNSRRGRGRDVGQEWDYEGLPS